MTTWRCIGWMAGAALLLVVGGTAEARRDDSKLDEKVERRIKKDPRLRDRDIDVDVENGVVRLKGSVKSERERLRAGRVAKIRGVKSISNEIEIEAKTRTDAAADTVADKTKKAGDVIDDGWITTKVKSKILAEDVLRESEINVDTMNNVVVLKGTVPTEAARAKAMEIARATDGVKNVVDQLVVVPKK